MRRIFVLFLMLMTSPLSAQTGHPQETPDVEVQVLRNGDQWTADYTFNRPAKAWVFPRSGVTHDSKRPWRPQSWMIMTPDVLLERRGHYDVLVNATGKDVPRKVRIRFAPMSRILLGEYDPALSFTDGSVALFSPQFDVFAFDDVSAIARFPIDLSNVPNTSSNTRIEMADRAGQMLYLGQRYDSVAITGGGSYVLFGKIGLVETPTSSMIVDPQLPEWIGGTLRRSIPKVLNNYTRTLGPPPIGKPTVMVTWAGPKKGVTSMTGSVLPNLVTMTFEGEGMMQDNVDARNYALWFIAHESAHFWLGNVVHEDVTADRWIFEGGADLLAYRSVAESNPEYDWRSALNGRIKECADLSLNRGVGAAEDRRELRAYYACGTVFGLVAEAASQKPFSAFIRRLIDESRSDRVLSRAEWLAYLDKVSGDRSLSKGIGVLLDQGSENPKAAIAALFTQAGVIYTLDDTGLPVIR